MLNKLFYTFRFSTEDLDFIDFRLFTKEEFETYILSLKEDNVVTHTNSRSGVVLSREEIKNHTSYESLTKEEYKEIAGYIKEIGNCNALEL